MDFEFGDTVWRKIQNQTTHCYCSSNAYQLSYSPPSSSPASALTWSLCWLCCNLNQIMSHFCPDPPKSLPLRRLSSLLWPQVKALLSISCHCPHCSAPGTPAHLSPSNTFTLPQSFALACCLPCDAPLPWIPDYLCLFLELNSKISSQRDHLWPGSISTLGPLPCFIFIIALSITWFWVLIFFCFCLSILWGIHAELHSQLICLAGLVEEQWPWGQQELYGPDFPNQKIVHCPVMENIHLFVCLCIYLFVSQKDLSQFTKMHKIQQDDIN